MNLSSFERRSLFAVVGLLILIGISVSIFLAIRYRRINDSLAVNLSKTVDLTNNTVARAVDKELMVLESTIKQTASNVAGLAESQQVELLKKALTESSLSALGIITTPTTHSYLVVTDNQQPLRKNQSDLQEPVVLNAWSEPYFSSVLQDWAIAYSMPLADKQTIIYGVVPLSFLKKSLFIAGSSASNYSLLTLADGTIITYQLASVLPAVSSIFDLLEINENEKALQQVKKTLNDPSAPVISYKDARIGQSVYLQARPLDTVTWRLVTVLYPADLLKENIVPLRHTVLLLSLALLITLCLIFFLCGLWAESFTAWWIVVTLICAACAAQLIFLWYLAINQPFEKHADYLMIADNTQLQAFIAAQNAKSVKMQPITPILTGVYIEEMLFSREASGLVPFVKMSGYIWQRYSKSAHAGLRRDFILPDGFELEKELMQTRTTQTDEIYTWRFACKHYETVTLLTYPFDHRHVSLRIVHPEILDSVMIVPDFSSYEHINPQLLPGIGSTVSLSNWNIYRSFFYYRMIPYNATLGLTDTPSISARPQMCFSLICQRTAIGELMSYLILILMSAIILFILLLSFSKHAEYAELMGFTNLNILTVVSGLLFVLIISQISLRENLDISGISYIESFYFIMYLLITGISIDSILFIFGRGGRLIQYQHNLIPKLAYWPLFFILSLIATVIAFY